MITTFTRTIEVEPGFIAEFFFNRIYTAGGLYFHVSVLNKAGYFCHFTMSEIDRRWKIVNAPKPPDWIIMLELQLDRIITHCMLS